MKDRVRKKDFERVIAQMLEEFPCLTEAYEEEMGWRGSHFPGLHIIVGDVFNPYLISVLRGTNEREKKKMFKFIEDMACDESDYVSNVAEVTICERIVFEGDWLFNKSLVYAHDRTTHLLWDLYETFNPGERATH